MKWATDSSGAPTLLNGRPIVPNGRLLIGIALANLAGVYAERKEYVRAEALFREVLQRYAETLPADHVNSGIARIRLGRALLGQRRFEEAAAQTAAGLEILTKQTSPPARWLMMAREDLVAAYGALNQTDKAASVRAEMADAGSVGAPVGK